MTQATESTASASHARATAPHVAVGFRPDIEGLRAFCVGAVVAFHAFPTLLPGGFIGVDIFFVISGFLITQLLLREVEATGRVDLIDFWARRIRRILPAATVVLCATAIMALFISAVDARLLGRHIIAAALFYYNWRQAGSAVDYLAQDDRDNPLLHYWSLAVEEQFYLVWPLLLAAIAWWLKGRASQFFSVMSAMGVAVGLLAVLSFALSVYVTATNAPLAFFSTFTRAWQLLAGAAVAVIMMRKGPRDGLLSSVVGLACLAAMAASCVLISETVPYPGFVAAAPTLAAALLLYFGAAQNSWPSSLLSVAPLRYVGRISFSWYLWHWPLIVFAAMAHNEVGIGLGVPEQAAVWAAIIASFCLAAATYQFVETPLRFSAALKASRRKTYLFGALLIAIGAGTGLAMKSFAPDSVPVGDGKFMSRSAIKKDRPVIYADRCLLRFADVEYDSCLYGDKNGSKTIVLYGDSHAGNWFSAINDAAKKAGWRVAVRIKASCRPIAGPQVHGNGRDYPECGAWRERVMAELPEIQPDLIVVSSMSNPLPAEKERTVFGALSVLAPTVVMRDTPMLPETPGDCLKRTGTPEKCAWRLDGLKSGNSYPKTSPSEMPEGVSILDLNNRICPDGMCRAITGGRVLMSDRHHLSDSFSKTLADEFEQLLRQHSN